MPTGKWPPPGFPIVNGDYAITSKWKLHLPGEFTRRIDDGSLVLWRPGLTLWIDVWGNDNNESRSERLAWMKCTSSPAKFAEREAVLERFTRYAYRLRDENEDGPLDSVNALLIADDEQVQMSVYFDDAADESVAFQIVESVALY